MTREEDRVLRQAAFVERVLGGTDSYPPSGWHDLNGETGRSALVWSLCRWRSERTGRGTLILPLAEPYDYRQTARWAGIPEELVIVTTKNRDLLRLASLWVKSGLVGQVVLENLGFLLGGGKYNDDLKHLLGELPELYALTDLAEKNDAALYATSYSVSVRKGELNSFSLGGSLLLDLCRLRRIRLTHQGYRLAAASRAGEYMTAANSLDTLRRRGHFEIVYEQGPVRLRNKA